MEDTSLPNGELQALTQLLHPWQVLLLLLGRLHAREGSVGETVQPSKGMRRGQARLDPGRRREVSNIEVPTLKEQEAQRRLEHKNIEDAGRSPRLASLKRSQALASNQSRLASNHRFSDEQRALLYEAARILNIPLTALPSTLRHASISTPVATPGNSLEPL
jgi:hypothetical protein